MKYFLTILIFAALFGLGISWGYMLRPDYSIPTEIELKVEELELKRIELHNNTCYHVCDPMNLPYERYEQAKADYEECVWRCVR